MQYYSKESCGYSAERRLFVAELHEHFSRWYAKDEVFGDTLVSDYNIRKYLKKTLQDAGIPKIEIERDSHRVRVFIHCAKPGMVIGKGGSEIDKYKKKLNGKLIEEVRAAVAAKPKKK